MTTFPLRRFIPEAWFALADPDRDIAIVYSGISYETNNVSTDVMHRKAHSRESKRLWSFILTPIGADEKGQFHFRLGPPYLEAEFLQKAVPAFDRASARAYVWHLLLNQLLCTGWDREFGAYGALRSHNPIGGVAFDIAPGWEPGTAPLLPGITRSSAPESGIVLSRAIDRSQQYV